MFSKQLILFTSVCVVFCGALALGQSTSGLITGTLTDPQGAVVPGATVTVKNLDTGLVRQASSDAAGSSVWWTYLPATMKCGLNTAGSAPRYRPG